jgi:hypothetical protein
MWPREFLLPITTPNGAMSDDDKIQAEEINGQSTQVQRDEAFCARMREAIVAGLESAPYNLFVRTEGSIGADTH